MYTYYNYGTLKFQSLSNLIQKRGYALISLEMLRKSSRLAVKPIIPGFRFVLNNACLITPKCFTFTVFIGFLQYMFYSMYHSILHAIVFVGLRQIYRWVTYVLIVDYGLPLIYCRYPIVYTSHLVIFYFFLVSRRDLYTFVIIHSKSPRL
jgi:hypothetical protein